LIVENIILDSLFDGIRRLRCSILYSAMKYRHNTILKRNLVFCDIHKGKRCFIIANGPSTKSQNLSHLKNEICFCVNYFYVSDDYHIINPKYYCMTHNHGMAESRYDDVMDSLEEHTSQDTTFFFPLEDMQRCTRNNRFKERNLYFVNFCNMSFKHLRQKGIDLTHTVPNYQSVSVMALEIAMYMGFSEIFLIGYDHDWILNDMRADYHSYDEEKRRLVQKEGFKKYDDKYGEKASFEVGLKAYLRLWKQYREIKKIADNKNIIIYNATNGGLLDVFPRFRYESLFK